MQKKGAILSFLATLCLLLTFAAPRGPAIAQTPSQPDAPAGCWRVVPTPQNNSPATQITKLSFSPPNELWAVGAAPFALNPPDNQPTILRWNGSQWDTMPAPHLAITGTYNLTSLKAFSQNDAWVLGNLIDKGQVKRSTAHWDGKQWTLIPLSNADFTDTSLSDIDGTSSSNLWVVGTGRSGPHGSTETGVTFHWDGKQWKQYETPALDNVVRLNRVAVTDKDAWAVGTHILHWDGKNWDGKQWQPTQAPCRDCQNLANQWC